MGVGILRELAATVAETRLGRPAPLRGAGNECVGSRLPHLALDVVVGREADLVLALGRDVPGWAVELDAVTGCRGVGRNDLLWGGRPEARIEESRRPFDHAPVARPRPDPEAHRLELVRGDGRKPDRHGRAEDVVDARGPGPELQPEEARLLISRLHQAHLGIERRAPVDEAVPGDARHEAEPALRRESTVAGGARAAVPLEDDGLDRRPGAVGGLTRAALAAAVGTAVGVDGVPVVAVFTRVAHAVAAARKPAVVAAVAAHEIAVVTVLARIDDPIATAWGYREDPLAERVADRPVRRVAPLPRAGIHHPVAAARGRGGEAFPHPRRPGLQPAAEETAIGADRRRQLDLPEGATFAPVRLELPALAERVERRRDERAAAPDEDPRRRQDDRVDV